MTNKQFWDNWVYGWAISREIEMPKPISNGYCITLDDDERMAEWLLYNAENLNEVLPCVTNRDYLCIALAQPFIVPTHWVKTLCAFMMYNENLQVKAVTLPDNMTIERQQSDARLAIIIRNEQGEVLCRGQIGYYGDFVIYDRIHTAENARRQGYASMVMNLLTQDANDRGISKGLLCAKDNIFIKCQGGKPWDVIAG